MKNVTIVSHPIVQHLLAQLRDQETPPDEFRRLLADLATFMTPAVTEDLPVKRRGVRTPVARTSGVHLAQPVLLVAILRAGLGMLDGMLRLIPDARVGFVGLKRDEHTLESKTYSVSLPPKVNAFEIILVDPMLATGGSAVAAMDLLVERGARHARLLNLVAAPEGIGRFQRAHPDVRLFTAAVDQRLNKRGYIVPGLGDAGDRLFGI
jgi:uracil phosphoribosyltransferase